MILNTELSKVENRLLKIVDNFSNEIVKKEVKSLLKSGGKRIRPQFTIYGAYYGKINDDVYTLAACIELLHMATLIHDDIIDNASLRRGKEATHLVFDKHKAVAIGDYMLLEILKIISKFNNQDLQNIFNNTIQEICIGELNQLSDRFKIDATLDDYYKRIERKTAILLSLSFALGGIVGGLNKKYWQLLYDFGYNVGMCYQIIDDILDFTVSEKELGKPAGQDLKNGNITLPVILAFEDKLFKDKLTKVLIDKNYELLGEFVTIIRDSEYLDKSYQIAQTFLHRADEILGELPNKKLNKKLQKITQKLYERMI